MAEPHDPPVPNIETFADQPVESDPDLRWFNLWVPGEASIVSFFTPPAGMLAGEVREVRIRRGGKADAFAAQVGFKLNDPAT